MADGTSPLEEYIAGVDPAEADLVVELDRLVRAAAPALDAAIKCRMLTYALEANWWRWASQRSAVSPMVYPAPVGRRTLRRVARATQHLRVGNVERRTASGERHDVVDGQVGGSVGGALVARAPVAVLATPGPQHPGAEPLPGPRAVQGVVTAAVGLAGVLGAPSARVAGDDTADRAQLHVQIVGVVGGLVYSPAVLRLRGQCLHDAARGRPEAAASMFARARHHQPSAGRAMLAIVGPGALSREADRELVGGGTGHSFNPRACARTGTPNRRRLRRSQRSCNPGSRRAGRRIESQAP